MCTLLQHSLTCDEPTPGAKFSFYTIGIMNIFFNTFLLKQLWVYFKFLIEIIYEMKLN